MPRPSWLAGVFAGAATGTASAAGQPVHGWPASLEQILTASSDDEFHAFVAPLAEMTKLTYTATWGSYYKEWEANATVLGWARGTLESNPRGGGMRALTFLQASSQRGVVAFRGTDLNRSGVSGQADFCADTVWRVSRCLLCVISSLRQRSTTWRGRWSLWRSWRNDTLS
jgi:hypothetical protein